MSDIKLSDLVASLERRLRVLVAAHEKVKEARNGLKEAEKTFQDINQHRGGYCSKELVSKITLGKYVVEVSFSAGANIEYPEIYTRHNIQFYDREGKPLMLKDILADLTHSDLDAFKYLKKNIDAFLEGKIGWPYPYTIKD
jgi:ribosome recycling factor